MIYGYARISTKKHALGNGLAVQVAELLNLGIDGDNIYTDVWTGKDIVRPNFQILLGLLKEGDTLIVTKLDRIARSTKEGIEVVQELLAKNVTVRIENMGTLDNTPMGKMILTVMLAFAEFERDMIIERTQSGKAHAKENDPNFRDGMPPKYKQGQVARAVELKLEGKTYKEIEYETGMSKSTVYRAWQKHLANEM